MFTDAVQICGNIRSTLYMHTPQGKKYSQGKGDDRISQYV